MLFLVIYFAVLILPGLAITQLFGIGRTRICLAIGFSVALIVGLLVVARIGEVGTSEFGYLLLVVYGGIFGVAGNEWRKRGIEWTWPRLQVVYVVPTITMSIIVGYLVWVGPYMEVPADAWWHLGRISNLLREINQNDMGSMEGLGSLFDRDNYYWHGVLAYLVYLVGIDLGKASFYITVGSTTVFCFGVYSFALRVFDSIEQSAWKRHLIAASTVLFFVTQFGIDVFSYIRYYVFSPGFLNYILYLSALVCVLEFLERKGCGIGLLCAGVILLLAAATIHLQEAIFIVVMTGVIALVMSVSFLSSSRNRGNAWLTLSAGKKPLILVLALACAYGIVHLLAYWKLERENPLSYGLLVDMRHYLPFLRNLYVLKPTEQFYEVITVWGVFVYALFVLNCKRLSSSPYLVAGMVVPFFTVFNPVFTDFFLRFVGSQVFWRMCYMVPLPFVAGYFLIKGMGEAIDGKRMRDKLAGIGVVAGLIVLLLPINTIFFISDNSKIYTLAAVHEDNSYRLWSDLLAFLENQERSGIITDRVTGYVINGLTKHKYRGYKFYDLYASHINRQSYENEKFQSEDGWKRLVLGQEFEAKKPWLVVINRRDGGMSEVGRLSGHWPADIMKVSKQYSDAFIEYVVGRPDLFQNIWERERITVYRVVIR
jgi:hypothetical protein